MLLFFNKKIYVVQFKIPNSNQFIHYIFSTSPPCFEGVFFHFFHYSGSLESSPCLGLECCLPLFLKPNSSALWGCLWKQGQRSLWWRVLLILWLTTTLWLTPSALRETHLASTQQFCLDLPTVQFSYTIHVQTLLQPGKNPTETEASSRHVPRELWSVVAKTINTGSRGGGVFQLHYLFNYSAPQFSHLSAGDNNDWFTVIVKRTMGSVKFQCLSSNPRSTS